MLRAAAAPERFLTSGYARLVSRWCAKRKGAHAQREARALAVVVPPDLARLLAATNGATIGDFVSRSAKSATHDFVKLMSVARRSATSRATLTALLAGAVPFGSTRSGELWVHVLAEPTSPGRGVVATLDPAVPRAPRLAFRDVATFALDAALAASLAQAEAQEDEEEEEKIVAVRARLARPGVAEQEAVRSAFERAAALADLILGNDDAVRRAARKLALRPLDVPPIPSTKKSARGSRLALGPTVEGFFRNEDDAQALAVVRTQKTSQDQVVAEAAAVLEDALAGRPRTALARDLARRRALAARAATARTNAVKSKGAPRLERTRRIVEHIDACPPPSDPLTISEAREEALLALAELGERSIVPSLVARAVTGDASAVEMLGALGDTSAVSPLVDILRREPQRYKQLEVAVVRTLAALGARSTCKVLRTLLEENPMPSWREGIERGVLVRELVSALGTLVDHDAAPALVDVVEERGQEYRAILPTAAWALGRIEHLGALGPLERLLSSPKEPVTCEAVWAVGAIGAAHANGRARATSMLEGLSGLEPGAEMVRLTALSKMNGKGASKGSKATAKTSAAPKTTELRRALERALWEPGFRQEETIRRRIWALRSLEELARLSPPSRKGRALGEDPFFLGHEAVRYFVTRDDHRVRRAAEDAFAACGIPVPKARCYFATVLDDVEARGGLDALHDALRDPLGVYRHNVATKLAERAHPSSVRPLAEAIARLFAEPPTSTYEYEDSPRAVVAFVRAVAKMNTPEGNDVLIDALRSGNHQVRAVVAENAPDDERFVPELMAMLGDPRSFLRSRAERSLASMGIRGSSGSEPPPPRLVEV